MKDWCDPDNHMWIVPGEGADPWDYMLCCCGAMTFGQARDRQVFARRDPVPVKNTPPGAEAPREAKL